MSKTKWLDTRIKKKQNNVLSSFVPTPEQEIAIQKINEFLDSKTENVFVLKGYAGTGKTTIVNHILKPRRNQGDWIAVSAFTNKATNVIARKTPFADAITLYRLLSLRMIMHSEELLFEKQKDSLVKNYNIIVLDESSMVLDENLDHLIEECEASRWNPIKLLIMGDPAQLPPVGQDKESKSFSLPNSFELTEVIRQSKFSNIFKYSLKVREFLKRIEEGERVPITTKIKIEKDERLSDLFFYDKSKDFLERLLEDFNSDRAKEDSDYVKVIAYRNRTVNVLNAKIRESLFGKDVEPITEKDELILNAPVKGDLGGFSSNVYDTSDEISVLSLIKDKYDNEHLGVRFRFPFYYCEVIRNFDGEKVFMNIVHPHFYDEFKGFMKAWAAQIKKKKNYKTIFKTDYYPFQERFHLPSYNYALTSHKSQGSTYNKVYVVEDDIERVRMASEKDLWKSKYVAYTRASEELHILNRQ